MSQKINLLMPTYNMGKFIAGAVNSALSQTFSDFELIIVDDASQDNTETIIRQFKDPRIKFVKNERNLGPIGNFNKCLSLADADFIVFLHADDMLKPNMLEKSYNLLKNNAEIGFSFSPCEIIDENNKYLYLNKPFAENFILPGEEMYKRHLYCNFVLFPSVLVRKKCLEAVKGFNENFIYTADWDLWLRIESLPVSVAYFSEPLAKYRIHSQSGTALLESKGLTEVEQYLLVKKHTNSALSKKLLTETERKKIVTLYRRRTIRSCFLRFQQALSKGKLKLAWEKIKILREWKKNPEIGLNYNISDLYLSAFSMLGIIIE